jgi:hypothetical protein
MQELKVVEDGGWVDFDLGIESYQTHGTEAHLFLFAQFTTVSKLGLSWVFPCLGIFKNPMMCLKAWVCMLAVLRLPI